jgi:uncharacterized membrane protein
MFGYPLKFVLGIALLFTNQIVGLLGIGACAWLSQSTRRKKYYFLGIAIYIVSWLMLLAGAALAGPQGMSLAKEALSAYRIETGLVIAVILGVAAITYVRRKKKIEAYPVLFPDKEA